MVCLAKLQIMKRCKRCKNVVYCSRQCQVRFSYIFLWPRHTSSAQINAFARTHYQDHTNTGHRLAKAQAELRATFFRCRAPRHITAGQVTAVGELSEFWNGCPWYLQPALCSVQNALALLTLICTTSTGDSCKSEFVDRSPQSQGRERERRCSRRDTRSAISGTCRPERLRTSIAAGRPLSPLSIPNGMSDIFRHGVLASQLLHA